MVQTQLKKTVFQFLSLPHPSIIYGLFPLLGQRGVVYRQGTPWTGGQRISGVTYRNRQPFTLTFTAKHNLASLTLPPAGF